MSCQHPERHTGCWTCWHDQKKSTMCNQTIHQRRDVNLILVSCVDCRGSANCLMAQVATGKTLYISKCLTLPPPPAAGDLSTDDRRARCNKCGCCLLATSLMGVDCGCHRQRGLKSHQLVEQRDLSQPGIQQMIPESLLISVGMLRCFLQQAQVHPLGSVLGSGPCSCFSIITAMLLCVGMHGNAHQLSRHLGVHDR